MSRKLLCIGLAVLAGTVAPPLATPAKAYFLDGDELLNNCSITVPDERFDPTICLSYVMGAYDAFMFQRTIRNQPRCTPRTLTGAQLREAVVAYLEANPDNRAMIAFHTSAEASIARLSGLSCKYSTTTSRSFPPVSVRGVQRGWFRISRWNMYAS